MYFLITPKKSPTIEYNTDLDKQIFKGDGQCSLQWLQDSPVLGIKYKLPDGSKPFFGGTLEPLFRITKKRATINKLVWTVTNEFPEYMKIETLFSDILKRIYKQIGTFKIHCLPLDRVFEVSNEEKLESVSMTLADAYPEIYRENEELLKKIEKNTNIAEVLKQLNELNTPYAMITAKLYAISLKDANILTNQIMDTLVNELFDKLIAKKYAKIRSFLVYKFMHGARFLRSGFLQHISPGVLTQTYANLIDKCSINLETTQFLLNDLIITGIHKAQDGTFRELKEHFIKKLLAYKGVVLLFPDIYSYFIAEKTGDFPKAFNTYVAAEKRNLPAMKLHEAYERLLPRLGFITGFKQDVLKFYYQKLPALDKVKNLKYAGINAQQQRRQPTNPTILPSFIATLITFIITGFALWIYTVNVQSNNDFLALAYKGFVSIVATLFGITFGFGWMIFFAVWGLVASAYYFRQSNSNKNSTNTVLAILGIPVLATIVVLFTLLVANIAVSYSNFFGTTKTHIVAGLDWYAYSDMQNITMIGENCTIGSTSCAGQKLSMVINEKNSRTKDMSFDGATTLYSKSNNSQNCKVIESIIEQSKNNNVEIKQGNGLDYKSVIDRYCRGKFIDVTKFLPSITGK